MWNGPRFRCSGVLLLALSFFACGGSDRTGTSQALVTVVDTSGAYPVVRNSGQAPVWDIQLVGSVGGIEGLESQAPDEFGRISSVTTGPNDWVWVADQFASQIKAFRPDGSLALTVGRQGQG